MQNLNELHAFVKSELDKSIDFWVKNGFDKKNGGMYTCLDQTGEIYSTDKSVWMQGRTAYTFAYLCNTYGEKKEWHDISKSCLDFLENHCINHDAGGRMYFTVTAEGLPLRQRRYCFSEGFYAIANAEYYALTKKPEYLERAKKAYNLIYQLNNGLIKDPTGFSSKTIETTRSGRALANPMIFLNISNVLCRVDPENSELYDTYCDECVEQILKYHRKKELKATLETVGLNGEFMKDITAGRVVSPGHDIECAWFLMEYANRKGDKELYNEGLSIIKDALDMGWDNEYGGILYFIDCLGKPPEAYEHDMKLWWPHNEALIALLMAYKDTKQQYYLDWLLKVANYCKQYFTDEKNGEWFGYLRRDGKPTQPSTKGSTFKGPFHLQRCLIMLDLMLTEIL